MSITIPQNTLFLLSSLPNSSASHTSDHKLPKALKPTSKSPPSASGYLRDGIVNFATVFTMASLASLKNAPKRPVSIAAALVAGSVTAFATQKMAHHDSINHNALNIAASVIGPAAKPGLKMLTELEVGLVDGLLHGGVKGVAGANDKKDPNTVVLDVIAATSSAMFAGGLGEVAAHRMIASSKFGKHGIEVAPMFKYLRYLKYVK